MSSEAELCPACKHPVRPGAAFCTHCGSPLTNRGARKERNVNRAQAAALDFATRQGLPDPGSISVVPASTAIADIMNRFKNCAHGYWLKIVEVRQPKGE